MADMQAALLYGQGDMRMEYVPKPQATAEEVLLKVRSVGVCGSDLHYYLEGGIGSAAVNSPLILGHEFAAEVVDERAALFGLRPGALVAVDPAKPCGHCEWCARGHANLCPYVVFSGSPPDNHGGLCEYVRYPREQLFTVPESFDADTTALLEPLGVAIHALDLAKLKPMDSVAILGAGTIGLLLLQVARHVGASDVYVIDPLAYRAEAAAKLGASAVATHYDEVLEQTQGRGVDVVLEATNSPTGPAHAAEIARIGGKLVLVGIPEGDNFSLQASLVRRKGLTIKLSRRMGHVYPRAIAMVAKGFVDLPAIVSHRFPLTQTPEAFATQASYRDGVIKTMVYTS